MNKPLPQYGYSQVKVRRDFTLIPLGNRSTVHLRLVEMFVLASGNLQGDRHTRLRLSLNDWESLG